MENRVFAAAIYPDGSPAPSATSSSGSARRPRASRSPTVKTNDAGLAEFTRHAEGGPVPPGRVGPAQRRDARRPADAGRGARSNLFDLTRRGAGRQGQRRPARPSQLNSEPLGENVLLRLDKAIYKGGEPLKVDIRTSAGMPTVYLDVVRGGQTLLTQLARRQGRQGRRTSSTCRRACSARWRSTPTRCWPAARSSAIAAWSTSTRATDLKINVKADKDVYLPGEKGTIRFQVTDAHGKPTAAALGVLDRR